MLQFQETYIARWSFYHTEINDILNVVSIDRI